MQALCIFRTEIFCNVVKNTPVIVVCHKKRADISCIEVSEINTRQEAKQRLRAQLSRELAKSNCDTQNAQTCNSAIEEYEKECAMLYRKLHNLTREMEKISKGGDSNED